MIKMTIADRSFVPEARRSGPRQRRQRSRLAIDQLQIGSARRSLEVR